MWHTKNMLQQLYKYEHSQLAVAPAHGHRATEEFVTPQQGLGPSPVNN